MKLLTRYEKLFLRLSEFYSTFIRMILNVLLVLICIALIVGIYKSGIDLYQSFNKPLETILQQMLLDTVFIVALVEIAITILGYLKDGQVQVRYIIDTILIIMLNEIVVLWFGHPKLEEVLGVCAIILTLGLVRVAVTRLPPKSQD